MKKLPVFIELLLVLALSLIVASCGGGGGGGGSDYEAEPSGAASDSGNSGSEVVTAPSLSSNAEILFFTFAQATNPAVANAVHEDLRGNPATVEGVATVTVTYPFESLQPADLTSLKPTIQVSEGARISPASNVEQDFTSPVEYTVTAQDGTTKVWTVSVTERSANARSITYDLNGGSMNVAAPNVYNVEQGATLPGGGNLVKDNYYFTGWTELPNDTPISSFWGANEKNYDVSVKANWSPAPYVKDHNIYANGMNVTVRNSSGKTMAYFRGANGNEIALSAINAAAEYQDLTGYTLYAGGLNNDNVVSASDCTITMEGGRLTNIYGYNGNGANISGRQNVIIQLKGGSVTNDVVGFVKDADGKPSNVAVNVSGNPSVGDKTSHGVWLNSLSSPIVSITGSISSAEAGAITLIAAGSTQNGTQVAEATSSSYADAGKFKLLTSKRNSVLPVGISESYVVVFGTVSLPEVPIWGEGDSFTLGDGHILEGGTYFSVFVKSPDNNAYFTVSSTTLKDENGENVDAEFDMAVPYSENGAVTYVEGSGLTTTGQYQYIQFKSTSGKISSKAADIYLAGIVFHGNNVTVEVNLQTVPIDEIGSLTYFNGSFYEIVKTTTTWKNAYDAAKARTFNGLHGYLMNITSHVENKFIYDRVYRKKNISPANGWIGGTAAISNEGYDKSTWTEKSFRTDWVWAAGPEAGQVFYTHRTCYTDSNKKTGGGDWVPSSEIYSSWNNQFDGTKRGTGASGAEPNNYNGTNEAYTQYVGQYYWNDLSVTSTTPASYIIEYTAYENNAVGHSEAATKTALSDRKTYSH